MSELTRSWEEAQRQWTITQSEWRDAKEAGFERQYWANFEAQTPLYLYALEELMTEIQESKRAIPG